MFKDRKDAGKKLADRLKKYKGKDVVILAIPRGGIAVGCEISRVIKAPLFALVVRKLPFPHDPEAGFGAVAEDGSVTLLEGAASWLPRETIERIIKEQIAETKKRIAILRGNRPLPPIKDKIAVLVDDGLAMGATMLAAVKYCRDKGAGKVVVAVPISGEDAASLISAAADETVILEKPAYFQAVAQGYENWYDVPYEEAARILNECSI